MVMNLEQFGWAPYSIQQVEGWFVRHFITAEFCFGFSTYGARVSSAEKQVGGKAEKNRKTAVDGRRQAGDGKRKIGFFFIYFL